MNMCTRCRRDESGATLILALVFVLIASFSVLGLVTLTGNDLTSTGNFRSERALEYAADGAADAALAATRATDNYGAPTQASSVCMPAAPAGGITINGDAMTVTCYGTNSLTPANCTGSRLTLGTCQYRTVTLYACLESQAASCTPGSTAVLLTGQVQFTDYSSTDQDTCQTSASDTTCGSEMSVLSWVLNYANS